MIGWKEIKLRYSSRLSQSAKLSPHKLLGVSQDASPEQIRLAYLRLVKAYHPDKSDPFMARYNSEMIKLINAAYDRLKDT